MTHSKVTDFPILYAIQGNSTQVNCFQASLSMPEPSLTNRSPPAGIGSLHPYLGSFGCMSYIIFLVRTTEELI